MRRHWGRSRRRVGLTTNAISHRRSGAPLPGLPWQVSSSAGVFCGVDCSFAARAPPWLGLTHFLLIAGPKRINLRPCVRQQVGATHRRLPHRVVPDHLWFLAVCTVALDSGQHGRVSVCLWIYPSDALQAQQHGKAAAQLGAAAAVAASKPPSARPRPTACLPAAPVPPDPPRCLSSSCGGPCRAHRPAAR